MNVLKQVTKKMGSTALILLFFSVFLSPIDAATITWTAGGTGNWSDGTKWGGGIAPGASDIAVINNGVVTLDVNISILQLKLGSTVAGAQGKLTIPNTMTLTLIGLNANASIVFTGGFLDIQSGGAVDITSIGTGACTAFNTPTNTGTTPATGLTNSGTITYHPSNSVLVFNTGGVGATPTMDFGSGASATLTSSAYAISVSAKGKGIIKGTFAAGTVATPGTGGLINQLGDNSALTIETGANLSFVGISTNGLSPINLNNTVASTTLTLTNKGTINISGNNTTGSVGFKFTGLNSTNTTTFDNQGSFTANLRAPMLGSGPGNFVLTNSGTMSLENSVLGLGAINFSSACVDDITITNSGTMGLKAVTINLLGVKGTITNTGTITSDIAFDASSTSAVITNSTGGILNFTGSSGSATATATAANVTLTNAGGTINTGTVTTTKTTDLLGTNTFTSGTLSPGGASNKGIMNITGTGTIALSNTLKIQVSGSTTAGTDYDKIVGVGAGFNVSSAILDLTGIYTPSSNVAAFSIISGASAITSPFSSIVGLGTGWGVSYTANDVQLSYTVLPVELVSFTATPLSKSNKLAWVTATESNNKGFDIQRQTQTGDWATIGFVAAQGKAATYTFEDNNPQSISYYRLRQVDLDGKETLSKIVSVNSDKKATAKVYPTLVKDIINVEFSGHNGATDVLIVNLLGQVVKAQKLQNTEGVTPMNISDLSTGSYIMRLVSKSGSESHRFEKQ